MAIRILPGAFGLELCPVNRCQATHEDPQNHSFFHLCYKHFRLAPIGLFALVLIPTSDFAAQGPSESDVGVSMKCVISMSDDIFFLKTSVFAAHEQSKSVFCISTRYALCCSMNTFDDEAPKWTPVGPQGPNMAPRWPQDDPKIAPRWPNIEPRWISFAPKSSRDDFQMVILWLSAYNI